MPGHVDRRSEASPLGRGEASPLGRRHSGGLEAAATVSYPKILGGTLSCNKNSYCSASSDKVGFAGLTPRELEKLLPCYLFQWIHQNGRQPLFLFPRLVHTELYPVFIISALRAT